MYDPRLRAWIEWGRRNRRWADTTCSDYNRRVRHWLDWCRDERLRPRNAKPNDVAQWLDTLHPTASVRQHARTALLAWFDWQVTAGNVRRNPVRDIPSVPMRRTIPRSLVPEAVTAVLKSADSHGPKWSCYIGLLAFAGLRRAEACRVRWVDLEGTDAWLRVLGKGSQERMVPIHESLRPLIVRWRSTLPDPTWMFPGRDGPMSVATATKWTREILDAAGTREATGHWLRHSMARRLVELGTPLPDVMGALGHRSLSSTSIYTRARPLSVQAAVAQLDF